MPEFPVDLFQSNVFKSKISTYKLFQIALMKDMTKDKNKNTI